MTPISIRIGQILYSSSLTVWAALLAASLALCCVPAVQGSRLHAASALEPGEDLPGGAATSAAVADPKKAFSQTSANLPPEKQLDFRIGQAVFRKIWPLPPIAGSPSAGLGPMYNARSCEGCHVRDGRGHPPQPGKITGVPVSLLLKFSIPPQTSAQRELLANHRLAAVPEPAYGGQLQDVAVSGLTAEGRLGVTYDDILVILAGGERVALRKPTYSIGEPGYGPLHPNVMMSPRIAPQMIGLGLLEAVPEASILALADPDDRDGDNISGRVNRVWSREQKKLVPGRFGWKAGAPTVQQQSAQAFATDMGLSSWLVPEPAGDCTGAQKRCQAAAKGTDNGGEVNRELLANLGHYARNLAVPKRRRPGDAEIIKGKQYFSALGCARCHIPSFTTGDHPGEPHLSHQRIWPYTDLLLHDMGEGLADNRPESAASGREWRTAPLWGIGLTQAVSAQRSFLHDGRARTIAEAILWHGGEAESARDGFASLSRAERHSLVAFVNSL